MINEEKQELNSYNPAQNTLDIINWVMQEKENIEIASDDIRKDIKQYRKNYKCYYSTKYSKYTNREKVFVPLTKQYVNAIVPKIRLDERGIFVNPQEQQDTNKALIMQELVRFQVKKNRLFQKLTSTELRNLAIDGTLVAKIYWDKELSECSPVIYFPDLLDIFINPMANSIEESPLVIEHFIVNLKDIVDDPKYIDTQFITPDEEISQGTYDSTSTMTYDFGASSNQSKIERVHLYEVWTDDEIITIAGEKSPVLIRKEKNELGYKPYVECWYGKVGRNWYGEGPANDLVDLQRWRNQVTNQRIDNRLVLQNPMFLVQKGMVQDISQLISRPGGFIEAADINGVKPLQYQDYTQGTFQDENVIDVMSERITGNFEIGSGGGDAETATEGVIKNRNIESRFGTVKDNIQDFIERMLQVMVDQTTTYMSSKTVVRITGEEEDLKAFDDIMGYSKTMRKKMGKNRFLEVKHPKKLAGFYDIEVDMDFAEVTDRIARSRRLIELAGIIGQDPESGVKRSEVYKEILRMNGFEPERFIEEKAEVTELPQMASLPEGVGQPQGQPSPAQEFIQQEIR